MTTADVLSASLEDYLEAIFHIVAEKHAARAKDIGKRMRVSRSSVTGALHTLAGKGLVNYAPYDLITLTKKGEAAAQDVVRRHEVLREFFVRVLAVDADDADEAACKMEHAVPPVFEPDPNEPGIGLGVFIFPAKCRGDDLGGKERLVERVGDFQAGVFFSRPMGSQDLGYHPPVFQWCAAAAVAAERAV